MSNWYLYNSVTGTQSEVVEAEIEALVKALQPAQVDELLAWRDGWTDWIPFSQVPELNKMRGVRPPPPPGVQAVRTGATTSPQERRRSRRYAGRLRVVLLSDGILFRSFSKDVSEHGLKVENSVPQAFYGREIECYISSPDLRTNLRFKAQLIASQDDSLRFEFVGDGPQEAILGQWLKDVVQKLGQLG